MDKPNFKDVKKLIKAINDTDNAFKSIYNDRQLQEKNIKILCNKLAGQPRGCKFIRDWNDCKCF